MNLLLINGGKAFGHSQGKLNHSLHTLAQQTLASLGHRTQETVIENGYDTPAEVEKILWADAVIWQMPGWWMGEPWTVKEYIDKVFSAGAGKLFASDTAPRPPKATAQAACCTANTICSRSHGTPRLKPLPARAIFLTAQAWTAFTCIFTKPTNF